MCDDWIVCKQNLNVWKLAEPYVYSLESVDLDQTPQNAVSDQGLQSLPLCPAVLDTS